MSDTQFIIVFIFGWIVGNLWKRMMRVARELDDAMDWTDYNDDNEGWRDA